MRDILFRAKEISTEKWVEGYLVKISEDDYRIATEEDINWAYTKLCDYDGVMTRVDHNTICQYTGLTDKNGNKIWENDVVRSAIITERKAKVVYGDFNCSCCYGVYGWTFEPIGEYSEICDIRGVETVEVIGNIFDGELGCWKG